MKSIFLQILSQLRFLFAFENWQYFLTLIDMLEYEQNTKETSSSDYKIILLKIEFPRDRYSSCSKVYYSIL